MTAFYKINNCSLEYFYLCILDLMTSGSIYVIRLPISLSKDKHSNVKMPLLIYLLNLFLYFLVSLFRKL